MPRRSPLFLSAPDARSWMAAFFAVLRSMPVASAIALMPWPSFERTWATIASEALLRSTLRRPRRPALGPAVLVVPAGRPRPRGAAEPLTSTDFRASRVDLRTSMSSSSTNSEMRFLISAWVGFGMACRRKGGPGRVESGRRSVSRSNASARPALFFSVISAEARSVSAD